MKTYFMYFSLLLIGLFSFQDGFCQKGLKKETIKVWGNCGMCKTTIESAALAAGATKANWSIKKKKLDVSFDPAITSNKSIQQAIADAGYDTQGLTANQEAYDGLHGCCQYERKSAFTEMKVCCADGKPCTGKKSCSDNGSCKSKSCCQTSAETKACCAEGKTCTEGNACKEKGCCAGKSCCTI